MQFTPCIRSHWHVCCKTIHDVENVLSYTLNSGSEKVTCCYTRLGIAIVRAVTVYVTYTYNIYIITIYITYTVYVTFAVCCQTCLPDKTDSPAMEVYEVLVKNRNISPTDTCNWMPHNTTLSIAAVTSHQQTKHSQIGRATHTTIPARMLYISLSAQDRFHQACNHLKLQQ